MEVRKGVTFPQSLPEKPAFDSRAHSIEDGAHLHRSISRENRSLTEATAKTNPQHALFCKMIGMPGNFDNQPYPSIWNIFSRKTKLYKGLYPRVRSDYQWHTFQYWLVAVLSNSILWLQIIFGAALTALGGTKSDAVSISIVVLGALQTVFGGFLTYFKSRNQPNRARQARKSLKKLLDTIENSEGMLRDPNFKIPPYSPMMSGTGANNPTDSWLHTNQNIVVEGVHGLVWRCMDMYMDAVREQEVNYPDFWMSNRRSGETADNAMMKEMLSTLKETGVLQHPATTASGPASPSLSQVGPAQSMPNSPGISAFSVHPTAGTIPPSAPAGVPPAMQHGVAGGILGPHQTV